MCLRSVTTWPGNVKVLSNAMNQKKKTAMPMLIDNERAPQWEPCYFPTGFLELSPVLWPLGNTSTSKTVVILHSLWHIFHGDQFAATAKLLQSCPTLCDPIDGSPPGSPVPGILQTRTLEWIAISFSNAWKWKVKWSRSVASDSLRPHGLQPTRLLRPWDFPGKSTGVGCHWAIKATWL